MFVFAPQKAEIFSIWNFIWSNNCVYNHIEIVESNEFLSVHSILFQFQLLKFWWNFDNSSKQFEIPHQNEYSKLSNTILRRPVKIKTSRFMHDFISVRWHGKKDCNGKKASYFAYYVPKPSLKTRTASALFWIDLDIFRDHALNFFLWIKLFCFLR